MSCPERYVSAVHHTSHLQSHGPKQRGELKPSIRRWACCSHTRAHTHTQQQQQQQQPSPCPAKPGCPAYPGPATRSTYSMMRPPPRPAEPIPSGTDYTQITHKSHATPEQTHDSNKPGCIDSHQPQVERTRGHLWSVLLRFIGGTQALSWSEPRCSESILHTAQGQPRSRGRALPSLHTRELQQDGSTGQGQRGQHAHIPGVAR